MRLIFPQKSVPETGPPSSSSSSLSLLLLRVESVVEADTLLHAGFLSARASAIHGG